MKKQLVIIGILTLFLTVGLSGCINLNLTPTNEKDYNRFIGTWEGRIYDVPITAVMLIDNPSSIEWTFFSNRTLVTKSNFTHYWKLEGNHFILYGNNYSFPFKYFFSENDTKLNLGGSQIVTEIFLIKVQ